MRRGWLSGKEERQRERERERAAAAADYRRRKAEKNEYVSAYNLVSHSRERKLLRGHTSRCVGETKLKRVPLGSDQPYPVHVSRVVPPVRYPGEDRPLSGDRTSASQTQASRPFYPSLPGFSFQLTVPPRVFLEYTHVPRKRKRTNESVAPLKPTCRCVRASQRRLRLHLYRICANLTASNRNSFVLAAAS